MSFFKNSANFTEVHEANSHKTNHGRFPVFVNIEIERKFQKIWQLLSI